MKKFLFSIASAVILTATLFLSSCNPETITSTKEKEEVELIMANRYDADTDLTVYTLFLASKNTSIYDPQIGDEFLIMILYSEDNKNFPFQGKYSCASINPIENDPYELENISECKMQFTGISITVDESTSIFGDSDPTAYNYVASGTAYVDGDATNGTIIFEVTLDDNTTRDFYYEGPLMFIMEE